MPFFSSKAPIAAALLLMTSSATAATKEGVTLPDSTTVAGHRLVLNGLGVREATVFKVDVYVAGLYLPKKTTDSRVIIETDQPRQLVLRFVRDVDVDDLKEAFQKGFEINAGARLAKLGDRIRKLEGWLEDVEPKDRIKLTYVPTQGLEFEIKGKRRGRIPGADFASVLFAIFVGPKPPNAGLKEGLLGR